jgi:hypothetical protein
MLNARAAAGVTRARAARIARGHDFETWDLELFGLSKNEPLAVNAFEVERSAGSGPVLGIVDQYTEVMLSRVGLERVGSWNVLGPSVFSCRVGRRA